MARLFLPPQGTAGPHTWIENLPRLCTCRHSMVCSSAGTGSLRAGSFELFCCFGNQNMQVASFSCVSQRTCLGWLYGAAISINFLSFGSLCRNLHGEHSGGTTGVYQSHLEAFFPSVLSIVKQFKYGQISKTSDTMQWIK